MPRASRPYMPGYGILGPTQGSGLLPWSWAEQRLEAARNYWVATVWPDGRPHLTAVWGQWHDGRLLFTCARRSRKARNLAAEPRLTVSTEDASDTVVLEGVAEPVSGRDDIGAVVDVLNRKYPGSYSVEFLASAASSVFGVRPRQVWGLRHDDFVGSPTRWTF
jgi:pyridoxamine 5'-phosphate oxidase-like protein